MARSPVSSLPQGRVSTLSTAASASVPSKAALDRLLESFDTAVVQEILDLEQARELSPLETAAVRDCYLTLDFGALLALGVRAPHRRCIRQALGEARSSAFLHAQDERRREQTKRSFERRAATLAVELDASPEQLGTIRNSLNDAEQVAAELSLAAVEDAPLLAGLITDSPRTEPALHAEIDRLQRNALLLGLEGRLRPEQIEAARAARLNW